MRNCLWTFCNGIQNIKEYITELESHNKFLSLRIDDHCKFQSLLNYQAQSRNFKTKKMVFDYKTIVISLYGLLENFLESSIKAYLQNLNRIIKNYSELPDKILNNHFDLSAELLQKLDLQKYQNLITKEEIIVNLHRCIATPDNYKLNIDAYTYHSANFKHEVVNDFFSKVGIYNISNNVRNNYNFINYLKNIYSDPTPETIPANAHYEKLNDLALRRNDVSHGVDCELLSSNILLEYLDYFDAYANSITSIIINETLPFEIKYNSLPLKAPIRIIDNKIICLNLENTKISKGNIMIARTKGEPYLHTSGRIQEIQINKENYDEVTAQPSVDVGIRVDFHAKDNQDFFLVKSS